MLRNDRVDAAVEDAEQPRELLVQLPVVGLTSLGKTR